MPNRKQTAVVASIAALTLAFSTGCRDTDALKDIVYDQNAPLIDYDNSQKFYINDSTAEEESDAVSAVEVSDEDPDSDTIQNLVVYSSEPNTEGFTTKQSVFSATPDFVGIEASETVCFQLSDAIDAFPHAVTSTQEEEPEDPPDEEEQEIEEQQTEETETERTSVAQGAASQETDQSSQAQGATQSDASENTDSSTSDEQSGGETAQPTPSDEGGGSGDETNSVEADDGTDGFTSSEGVGEYKNPTIAFDISNRDAEITQVDSIAAFGEYAYIVQMIGGDGALAATDAETLASLQSAGVSVSASTAWSDDSGDPSSLVNVKALVASGAQVIVVEDPATYTAQLSYERFNYLEENGIQWVSLRDLCSSTYIKTDVETIGDMLQGSAVAQYGSSAASRAQEYVSFHDSCVEAANGGLASDTVNGACALQYNKDADGLSYSSNDATYTLLIDYWDENACCVSSGLAFDPGTAYASAGYATTPVSYYIQAGGSINNAAARTTVSSSGEIPVLQFAQTESWTASMWKNASLSNILYGVHSLLDTGVDQSGTTTLGKGFGSDAMPKIIVTSSNIKNALVASSASSSSLYHAYSYTSNDLTYGAVGLTYTTTYGTTSLWSCIGSVAASAVAGTANPTYASGAIDADDILVNPSGLFCSWTEGSVESFLEAGWVAAYVNGTYSATQWQQDVADFYSWAWGIDVSISAITNQ